MSAALQLQVAGLGLWSPEWPDITALADWLGGTAPAGTCDRPLASWLAPNERRRAPPGVLQALEVAGQALAAYPRPTRDLRCVFTSAYGEQSITDYMCRTLASSADSVSPTRFHHSVHNAAVGYWTITQASQAASSALCAARHSVGAALLEAASQVLADQQPVLLVGSDTAGQGPLLQLTSCLHPLAFALLLLPPGEDPALPCLNLNLGPAGPHAPPSFERLPKGWPDDNPMAHVLPLLAALLAGRGRCMLGVADAMLLSIDVESAQ